MSLIPIELINPWVQFPLFHCPQVTAKWSFDGPQASVGQNNREWEGSIILIIFICIFYLCLCFESHPVLLMTYSWLCTHRWFLSRLWGPLGYQRLNLGWLCSSHINKFLKWIILGSRDVWWLMSCRYESAPIYRYEITSSDVITDTAVLIPSASTVCCLKLDHNKVHTSTTADYVIPDITKLPTKMF